MLDVRRERAAAAATDRRRYPEVRGVTTSRALLVHAAPQATPRYADALGAEVTNITAGGYSGGYDEHTGIAAKYPSLADALNRYAPDLRASAPLALVGFSAGCWAVRGWLNHPGAERASVVVFVDGLHAGGDDARAHLGPQHAGVLAYARRAVAGKCGLIITHSQIVPPGYASTRATADAVLSELGLRRVSRLGVFQLGGLVVAGFPGDDAAAHSRQLMQYGPEVCRTYARGWLDGGEPGSAATPTSGGAATAPASQVPPGSASSSASEAFTVGAPTTLEALAVKLGLMWVLRKVFG